MAYLDIRDLNVYYGGIHALRSVDMRVEKGEIVAVIGANGAGKSTLMRSIAGDQKYKGAIVFDGAQLPGFPPRRHEGHFARARRQAHLSGLSVLENLWIGAYAPRTRPGSPRIWRRSLRFSRA